MDYTKDKEYVRQKLIEDNSNFKHYATKTMRDDKDFIVSLLSDERIKGNGRACIIPYLSSRLRDDKDVILSAVGLYWGAYALRFASYRLCGDKDVILAAITKDPFAIVHAAPAILKDDEVVNFALSKLDRGDRQLLKQKIDKRLGMIKINKYNSGVCGDILIAWEYQSKPDPENMLSDFGVKELI